MTVHMHSAHDHPPSFWRSRTGMALLVFLGVAVALLVAEHWAHLAGSVLLVPLLLCGLMHLLMHGHGGHHHGDARKE